MAGGGTDMSIKTAWGEKIATGAGGVGIFKLEMGASEFLSPALVRLAGVSSSWRDRKRMHPIPVLPAAFKAAAPFRCPFIMMVPVDLLHSVGF